MRQWIVGEMIDDFKMLASALRQLCCPETPLLWGISQDNNLMVLVWGSDLGLDPEQTVRIDALLHKRNAGAMLRRAPRPRSIAGCLP